MPTRRRIQHFAPSGGGGGSIPVFVVGPDFGEGSDDNTWTGTTTLVLDQVNPTFDAFAQVTTSFDLDAINIGDLAVGTETTSLDLDQVNIGDLAVGTETTSLDLDQVNIGDLAVGTETTSLDLDQVNPTFDAFAQVTTSFAGTVTGAPFWQAAATAARTTTGFTLDCNVPAGVVDGELLLAFVGVAASTLAQPIDTPAGWTLAVSASLVVGTPVLRGACFWRIASSEPASYTFTLPDLLVDPETFTVEIHRIRGAHATTPIDSSSSATLAATVLDPDPDAPSVTTIAANCLVFAWVVHDHLQISQTHTPGASHVERTDFQSQNSGSNARHASCSQTRVFATPGGTGLVPFDCTETVSTNAVLLRVAVAPGSISFP